MDAKQCIKFLKSPFLNPITGAEIEIDGPEYTRLNEECYRFIHFDILSQTDVRKFIYPKDTPVLSFLSAVYFMNLTEKITCQPFKSEYAADQLVQPGEDAFIRNFDFGFVIKDGILYPPRDFKAKLAGCSNRFVILLVTIIDSGQITANLLLHDKKDQEWERFIPFGSTQMSSELSQKVDNLLIKYLERNGYSLHDYYQPYVGCPIRDKTISKLKITPHQQGIYCAVWGVWFIYLKLQNPDVWREHLIYTALERISDNTKEFNEFVREYLSFLVAADERVTYNLKELLNNEYSERADIDKFLADEIFALLK